VIFRIGFDNELIAEKKELQPAFVKGAIAAHEGRPNENPYKKQSCRRAYDIAYAGVKEGKVIVEEGSSHG
jgi:hypothetical protein